MTIPEDIGTKGVEYKWNDLRIYIELFLTNKGSNLGTKRDKYIHR